MGNVVYPKYTCLIPDELHTKLKYAYADKVLDPSLVAAQVRWFLKALLEGQGVRFTKDYENSMKRALLLTDAQGIASIKEIVLVKETKPKGGQEGHTSDVKPFAAEDVSSHVLETLS